MPMRQLRSCDFCGEDASGIYEVLPSELSPTEEEQRRVVLCDDCLRTLETVLDPLLARLGFDAAKSRDTAVEERGDSPEPVAASEMSNQEERTISRRPVGTSAKGTADVTPMTTGDAAAGDEASEESAHGATTDVTDEGTTAGGPDADDVPETGDEESFGDRPAEDYEVDEDEVAREEAAREGTTADGPDADAGDSDDVPETSDEESFGDRPAEDYEVDDADRKQSVEGDPAEDYEVEEGIEATPARAEGEDSASGAEPERFRKVMRLLNNREFPVDRAEFSDLASGAYEMDRAEVAAIIDHAIERDVLEEEDGELRKP